MKRIIVLCDGTGQSASRGAESVSTNVNRIGHALKNRGPVQQLVFYQSGIGTEDLGQWSKAMAGMSEILSPGTTQTNFDKQVRWVKALKTTFWTLIPSL
jgi:hypothetical protein